ncbi:MAG: acetolactate synthase small subunit [Lachnospiraceae bacterium]|nr:acetolactate synthase small subunit [Lachnospiraceae bacterium]
MSKKVFSVLVSNTSGVLNRVAALFSRRAYNIDSLTVGETENPEYSRMTIATSGDDDVLEQIEKQISKLEDVIEVTELTPETSVYRELVLVKVAVNAAQRQEIAAIANIFRVQIVDVSKESVMIELIGNQSKLDAFLELLEGYKIEQLVRTGITGLLRGKVN